MSLSNMVVFQEYVKTTVTEIIAQQVNLFNASTRGAITLQAANHDGDYSEASLYAKIPGLVRRRNAYGSGAVTPAQLQQLLDRSVKVAAGTPPVVIDPNMFTWINKSPEEAGIIIGRQLAGDQLGDMLNVALASMVPVFAANAALTNDVSGGGSNKATLKNLNGTARKFGDRSADIVAWLMHSDPMHDLYDNVLTNTEQLFEFGNVQIREDGFGRILVMTDSPAFLVSGTPNKHATLGLVAGACVVGQNDDFFSNVDTDNGDENIARTYQAEWSYNVGIRGYAWDAANGGASPNDGALQTATNWDQYATSIKDTAGVVLLTDNS